jgi:hypothetical protein
MNRGFEVCASSHQFSVLSFTTPYNSNFNWTPGPLYQNLWSCLNLELLADSVVFARDATQESPYVAHHRGVSVPRHLLCPCLSESSGGDSTSNLLAITHTSDGQYFTWRSYSSQARECNLKVGATCLRRP